MTSDESKDQTPRNSAAGLAGKLLTLGLALVLTANIWLLSEQTKSASSNSRERAFWSLCHSGTTPELRTEYFLQLVTDGNQEWKSAVLTNLNLESADLSGASIESAVFSSCNFVQADFTDAELNRSGLDNSDLSRAVFSGAGLRNATLFKSELNETIFRNADLLSTSLEQAKAKNAIFVAAKMGDAFLAMTDATGADFTGADLSGANLEAAILKNADLALANLYGTHLKDTDFTDSNWWRSRGLSTQQLDDLTLQFPPTPSAPESRQRDFEIWLTKRIEDSGKNRPAPE